MAGKLWTSVFWVLLVVLYVLTVKYDDSVVFLDVGQGDAILIQSGTNQILIDGGPNENVVYKLQKYMPFFDRKIEYVVLTHPHQDHLGGLLSVMERYEVGEFWYYPVCYSNIDYGYLLQNFDNVVLVGRGDTLWVEDIQINVVWPILESTTDTCIQSFDGNVNNDSLVLDFEYLGKNFLLMGDIESKVEEILVRQEYVLNKYDVLKAGHHCSKTSNSETFLKYISPSIAICSVAQNNSFGHPSSETLKNFSKLNVQYLLTSVQGDIQIK